MTPSFPFLLSLCIPTPWLILVLFFFFVATFSLFVLTFFFFLNASHDEAIHWVYEIGFLIVYHKIENPLVRSWMI